MDRSRLGAVGIVVLALAGATGCATDEVASSAATTEAAGDPPTMDGLVYASWTTVDVVTGHSVGGPDAGVTGDAGLLRGVVADRGGCLRIEGDSGLVTPILPEGGGKWAGLHVGDEVSLSGGLVDTPPGDALVPQACAADAYWLALPEEIGPLG